MILLRPANEPISTSESRENIPELKATLIEIGLDGTREGFKFALLMLERYPELKSA